MAVNDTEPTRRQQRSELRRIARLFGPYRGRLGAVLALIAVSASLGMVSPFLLREVLDTAIPEADMTLLTWLVGGMIVISIATGALGHVDGQVEVLEDAVEQRQRRLDLDAHAQQRLDREEQPRLQRGEGDDGPCLLYTSPSPRDS